MTPDIVVRCTFYITILAYLCISGFVGGEFTCPYHCTCIGADLSCKDGFTFDSTNLRLVDADVETITIENFILRDIPDGMFRRFANLRSLEILDSRVRSLAVGAFKGLSKLEYLSLENNHIVELEEILFNGLPNLTYINLGRNLIESLPERLFASQTDALKQLNLSNNRIRFLPTDIFNNLVDLEHLDLSNNELSYILPNTFNFLSSIRFIDLNDNLLVTIHEDLFGANNVTILTKLSVLRNPLVCNCGLRWLREVVIGNVSHMQLLNTDGVVCSSPHAFHGKKLMDVSLESLSCTPPTVEVSQKAGLHYYRNEFYLECTVKGDPTPSVVWRTPMGDYISDPNFGAWIDNSINRTSSEKLYQVYATGEQIDFTVKTSALGGVSRLIVSNTQVLSSGDYECIALNPGGNNSVVVTVQLSSAIDTQFISSIIFGGCTVLAAMLLGVIGCSVTACLEKCLCCPTPILKYYDGDLIQARMNEDSCTPASSQTETGEGSSEDQRNVQIQCDEAVTAEETDDAEAASMSVGEDNSSLSNQPSTSYGEINEHTALTAEEWDAYFREFPDDFVIECLSESPRRYGSARGSPRGSPTNRGAGRTIDTLEGVRLRLKLRVEQIDVMRERLRNNMGKRGARMKDNMAKQKLKMNKTMQTIKESTSHSLQSIKETGRSYSHKLHKGVMIAMENVGDHVKSLKEFCGTGDMGNTLSIATITTDIDTEEVCEMKRSVTEV